MTTRVLPLLLLALLEPPPAVLAQADGPAGSIPVALAQAVAPPLRYQRTPVAPGDDGYALQRLAADLVRGPDLDPTLSSDETEALSRNTLSLWLFDQARERPAFRWPPYQVGEEVFSRHRQVFLLALARARGEEADAAASDLVASLELARRMGDGESQLIHFLVALWLERRVLQEVTRLAGSGEVSERGLNAMASAVAAGAPACEVYTRAWQVEFNTLWLPTAIELERRGEWHGPAIGEAIPSVSEALAAHLAECGSPLAFSCRASIEGLDLDPAVIDAAVWGWAAEREATSVVLALRRYERRHGSPSPSLSALVEAGVLTEAPRDPITAGPFRYDPEARALSLDPPARMQACRDAGAALGPLEWRW